MWSYPIMTIDTGIIPHLTPKHGHYPSLPLTKDITLNITHINRFISVIAALLEALFIVSSPCLDGGNSTSLIPHCCLFWSLCIQSFTVVTSLSISMEKRCSSRAWGNRFSPCYHLSSLNYLSSIVEYIGSSIEWGREETCEIPRYLRYP